MPDPQRERRDRSRTRLDELLRFDVQVEGSRNEYGEWEARRTKLQAWGRRNPSKTLGETVEPSEPANMLRDFDHASYLVRYDPRILARASFTDAAGGRWRVTRVVPIGRRRYLELLCVQQRSAADLGRGV